jgi:hypothetical protein
VTCPLHAYLTRIDAMDRALELGMVLIYTQCNQCGHWHLRDAKSKTEAANAARAYRRHISLVMPGLAKSRGWRAAR